MSERNFLSDASHGTALGLSFPTSEPAHDYSAWPQPPPPPQPHALPYSHSYSGLGTPMMPSMSARSMSDSHLGGSGTAFEQHTHLLPPNVASGVAPHMAASLSATSAASSPMPMHRRRPSVSFDGGYMTSSPLSMHTHSVRPSPRHDGQLLLPPATLRRAESFSSFMATDHSPESLFSNLSPSPSSSLHRSPLHTSALDALAGVPNLVGRKRTSPGRPAPAALAGRKRNKMSREQLQALEAFFEKNRNPVGAVREHLARKLDVNERSLQSEFHRHTSLHHMY